MSDDRRWSDRPRDDEFAPRDYSDRDAWRGRASEREPRRSDWFRDWRGEGRDRDREPRFDQDRGRDERMGGGRWNDPSGHRPYGDDYGRGGQFGGWPDYGATYSDRYGRAGGDRPQRAWSDRDEPGFRRDRDEDRFQPYQPYGREPDSWRDSRGERGPGPAQGDWRSAFGRSDDHGPGHGPGPRREHPGERNWMDQARDEVASWFGDHDAEARRDRDRAMQGEHRGRGPAGYRRSDERIREDVHDRLTDDSWLDASKIEVTVQNGEVTLTGEVHDKTDRRRAESLAERVSGAMHVQNLLRVKAPHGYFSTSGSEQAADAAGATGTAAAPGSEAALGAASGLPGRQETI